MTVAVAGCGIRKAWASFEIWDYFNFQISNFKFPKLARALQEEGAIQMNRFLPFLVLFGVQVVGAQTTNALTRSLSLAECIRIAVEHNFDVKIEQKAVDLARHRLSLAYSDYDPSKPDSGDGV